MNGRGGIFTGDWGESFLSKEKVWDAITSRFPVSLQLMLMAQVMALALALPLGMISAYRPGGRADRIIGGVAFASVSMPSFMTGVLQENYISLARAKGMSDARILWGHALRPSSFTMLTILGLQVARLMGGAIIIEQIFGIPGVGRLLIHAVYTRDFIVIQGCVTFFALAFVVANFMVDVAYAWLDPRVRQGRAHG